MLELLFESESNLLKHRGVPLLKEREDFLVRKQSEGCQTRELQILASLLLETVNILSLKDKDKSIITLDEILEKSSLFRNQKQIKFFISTTINWLNEIGRLDLRYCDHNLLFNHFSTICHYRIRYITYPMYHERLSYLNYMQSLGMSFNRLREHAEMQLHIIDELGISEKKIIHQHVLDKTIIRLAAYNSLKWMKTFKAVSIKWLSFIGILERSQEQLPRDNDLIIEYINWSKSMKGLSDITLKGRHSRINDFSFFIQDKTDLAHLNISVIDEYIQYRHNAGCCKRTLSLLTTNIREYVKFLNFKGICDICVEGIRHPKEYSLSTLPSAPSWDIVEKLLSFYDISTKVGKRNTAILALLSIYGLRTSEVTRLKLRDIDWDKRQLCFYHVKNGHVQSLPLSPYVYNLLIDYIVNGRDNKRKVEEVFMTTFMPYKSLTRSCIYKIVSDAYKGLKIPINIKHIGGHSLRHACASNLINNGVSLKEIGDILGHRLQDTTRIYSKIDITNLRKVSQIEWEVML